MVAEGKPLSFKQEDLKINGHALELRVYAEDPANNFLPDIGTLQTYKRPQGPGIRVDDGFQQGMQIPIYYDPMIAKLVTWGKNREEARMRMLRAIKEYQITGITTTLPFGRFVLEHDAFISGQFDTKFVENYFRPELLHAKPEPEEEQLAAALAVFLHDQRQKSITPGETASATTTESKWRRRSKL